jgi:hypothetical protein
MRILLGLGPFIAFFALMRLASPMAGLCAALFVSAVLGVRARWRGESIKILEIGSLALFAALVVYTVVAQPAWTVATVRLAVDAGLLAIVVLSLAIGRPFTLQYAREAVPREFWATPRFIATNRLITAIWAAAFAVLVAADAAAEYLPSVPLAVDIAASLAALTGAFWFSTWYPAVVRRAAAGLATGEVRR